MKEDPVVFIKELSEQDRPFMLNHFLGLSPADRRLRFGAALPDEAVTKYVNAIDFNRDTIFGVYESTFNLVGVGHLAFPLPENLPPSEDVQPNRVAEFAFRFPRPCAGKTWVPSYLTVRPFIAGTSISIPCISIALPRTGP